MATPNALNQQCIRDNEIAILTLYPWEIADSRCALRQLAFKALRSASPQLTLLPSASKSAPLLSMQVNLAESGDAGSSCPSM